MSLPTNASSAEHLAEFRRVLGSNITTAEAAQIAGMTPASFRKAMMRDRQAGNPDCRVMLDGRTVLWSEAMVRGWLDGRPGRGRWGKRDQGTTAVVPDLVEAPPGGKPPR